MPNPGEPDDRVQPHKLLRALDAVVRDDHAPSGCSGSVVVAVKGQARSSFWHATFGDDRLLGCGYLEGVPPDADAILLFEEAQAADVLEGKMPEGKVAMFGQHELLEKFVDRYCTFRSLVDVRSTSKAPKSTKRRGR